MKKITLSPISSIRANSHVSKSQGWLKYTFCPLPLNTANWKASTDRKISNNSTKFLKTSTTRKSSSTSTKNPSGSNRRKYGPLISVGESSWAQWGILSSSMNKKIKNCLWWAKPTQKYFQLRGITPFPPDWWWGSCAVVLILNGLVNDIYDSYICNFGNHQLLPTPLHSTLPQQR